MNVSLLWLILAVVALAAELTSLALYLGSFGVAALVTLAVSLVAPLPVQLVALAVSFAICLFGVRPLMLRLLPVRESGSGEPVIGPIGKSGLVTERVDARGGQIRIGHGEFWSARALAPDGVIEPNQAVTVERMEGLVAMVSPAIPLAHPAPAPALSNSSPFGLSEREIEILRLVAAGRSNVEIARDLFLSPRTVDHHVSHILAKMNVDRRLDAARLAIQRGIAEQD